MKKCHLHDCVGLASILAKRSKADSYTNVGGRLQEPLDGWIWRQILHLKWLCEFIEGINPYHGGEAIVKFAIGGNNETHCVFTSGRRLGCCAPCPRSKSC